MRFEASSDGASQTRRFSHPWAWALDKPDHATLLAELELDASQQEQAMQIFQRHRAVTKGWSHQSMAALQEVETSVLRPAQQSRLAARMAEEPPSLLARVAEFARRHELLPEAYLFGCCHVWRLAGTRTAFLNGEISHNGWWWFFPFTFLVKTPLLALALMAVGVWIQSGTRVELRGSSTPPTTHRILNHPSFPLWAFLVVFCAIALVTRVNIGHRHILPVYPAVFILCGSLAHWRPAPKWMPWRKGGASAVLVAAFVALGIESAAWYPNYLAYFNGLVPAENGYRHLIDSSLDWGQELPAIRKYLATHSSPNGSYLAYFGMGSPSWHGIQARRLYEHPGFEKAQLPALKLLPLEPGDNGQAARRFLSQSDDYDPDLTAKVDFGNQSRVLLVKRPAALRISGGTYVISATLLQPVHYSKAFGPWSTSHETTYQQLRMSVSPFLRDDRVARAAALESRSAVEWLQLFADFEEYRFARITAFLRRRQPDDQIGHSVLVYSVSDEDVARMVGDLDPPLAEAWLKERNSR
jgi:hypothetical protein